METYEHNYYTLKYPENLNVFEFGETPIGHNIVIGVGNLRANQYANPKSEFDLLGITIDNAQGKTIDEMINYWRKYYSDGGSTLTDVINENIGNKPGKSYTYSDSHSGAISKTIYVSLSDDKYAHISYPTSEHLNYQNTIQKIIDSIKFE